jgi:hypothetical protein
MNTNMMFHAGYTRSENELKQPHSPPFMLFCQRGENSGCLGPKRQFGFKEDNWDEISYVKGLAIAVLRLR